MPMTKEEFKTGMLEMRQELEDPTSELSSIREEADVISRELRDHDVELSGLFDKLVTSLDNISAYVKSRFN